ncbi:MAG: acyltransferase domain-containing protein, partial [Thermoanaerobaculia bacterium]
MTARTTAFAGLFPGQLSERAGMGEALAAGIPRVDPFFDEVSRRAGVDLRATFFGDGAANLHDNLPAQVGVYAVSVAVLDVLDQEFGRYPEAVAGYSLGTYAAFVAAGALDRWQALDVLLEAERLLGDSPVPGSMGFVIGLTRPVLEELLRSVTPDTEALSIATENAAQQLVITGDPAAVSEAIALAQPRSLRAELLPLSCPMHSPRLRDVSERLQRFVEA